MQYIMEAFDVNRRVSASASVCHTGLAPVFESLKQWWESLGLSCISKDIILHETEMHNTTTFALHSDSWQKDTVHLLQKLI